MAPRLESYASVDALPAEADALFAASDSMFTSRAWWRVVAADAMPAGSEARFLLGRDDAGAVALWPLCVTGGALHSLTTPYTCRYMPLLAPDLDADRIAAAFAAFGRFCRDGAMTRLDALPAEWPWLDACAQGARAAGLVPVRFAHFGNWHQNVSGQGWDDYLAQRPGALRETIRRRLNRAARRAESAFALHTGGAELEAGIAMFQDVYDRSWKQPEPFPRFNAALMRATAADGLLRLGIWSLGGKPVAAQFWIVEHGTATVLKLAHDEAFKTESPGTVLTALMLRRLLDAEQVSEIDFGRGDDSYKRDWTGERRLRVGLVFANPRRPAALAFLARHALGRLRGRMHGAP